MHLKDQLSEVLEVMDNLSLCAALHPVAHFNHAGKSSRKFNFR